MNNHVAPADINLTTLRMMWLALIGGLVVFGSIALYMGSQSAGEASENNVLMLVGLGVAFGGWGAGLLIPHLFSKNGRKGDMLQPDTAQSNADQKSERGAYVTQCLVRWAMFEGPGMFGGVLLINSPSKVALGLVAVSIVLLLATGPSASKMGQ